MARTTYVQSFVEPTMTVAQLIQQLQAHDPAAPVIFRSPGFGCYGPDTEYALDGVKAVSLERSEERIPGGTRIDDETGEEEIYAGWTEVQNAWSGVVIF